MGDAEDLALLGAALEVRVVPMDGCPVASFVDSNGLMPGRARAIEVSALYRMYLEWARGAQPVSPLMFTRRIHALGFMARKKYANSRPLKANTESAHRLRRWLELNPQPFGWAKEFQSRIWGKGGK